MERIRIATQDDRAAVEEIVQAAYQPWAELIGIRPLPMEADYRALIEAGQVFVTGAVDGLIVLVPEDGCLLIENVAVRPGLQRRGIGRRLLTFAEDRARSAGLPALRLYTNELMASNIALYESLGYRVTGRERIDGRQAVHMRKG
jgi:ribosomal protein S18 acetylase RimI-like enzyme